MSHIAIALLVLCALGAAVLSDLVREVERDAEGALVDELR